MCLSRASTHVSSTECRTYLMLNKRLTASSFALSALVAIQSAGAQERNPGQTIPSNGKPQVSDQQISATQNREGFSAQTRPVQNGVPGTVTNGPIVDGQGSLSGQTHNASRCSFAVARCRSAATIRGPSYSNRRHACWHERATGSAAQVDAW